MLSLFHFCIQTENILIFDATASKKIQSQLFSTSQLNIFFGFFVESSNKISHLNYAARIIKYISTGFIDEYLKQWNFLDNNFSQVLIDFAQFNVTHYLMGTTPFLTIKLNLHYISCWITWFISRNHWITNANREGREIAILYPQLNLWITFVVYDM